MILLRVGVRRPGPFAARERSVFDSDSCNCISQSMYRSCRKKTWLGTRWICSSGCRSGCEEGAAVRANRRRNWENWRSTSTRRRVSCAPMGLPNTLGALGGLHKPAVNRARSHSWTPEFGFGRPVRPISAPGIRDDQERSARHGVCYASRSPWPALFLPSTVFQRAARVSGEFGRAHGAGRNENEDAMRKSPKDGAQKSSPRIFWHRVDRWKASGVTLSSLRSRAVFAAIHFMLSSWMGALP